MAMMASRHRRCFFSHESDQKSCASSKRGNRRHDDAGNATNRVEKMSSEPASKRRKAEEKVDIPEEKKAPDPESAVSDRLKKYAAPTVWHEFTPLAAECKVTRPQS